MRMEKGGWGRQKENGGGGGKGLCDVGSFYPSELSNKVAIICKGQGHRLGQRSEATGGATSEGVEDEPW